MRIRLLMLIGAIGAIASITAAPTATDADASGDARQSAAPGAQGTSVSGTAPMRLQWQPSDAPAAPRC
jgi:hypothetical protein